MSNQQYHHSNSQQQLESLLPTVLQNEKMMKFGANIDGKALLHDLDQKFDTQDRMMNYLVSQINSLENHIQNLNRKAQTISD